MANILHHGAVDGVTGSAHELILDEHTSLLIDCGLFQGSDRSASGNASAGNLAIDFDTRRIQALIATHVHIDHVGRIPWLLASGFEGPILCSIPSAKLLPIVLEDAFRLGFSRHPGEIARYLKIIESRLVPLAYDTWHTVVDTTNVQARIRLQRAGHILGSAYVECDITYSANTSGSGPANHRVVFSGDLGAPHAPLLRPPQPPECCDTLVIESTYGDRNHESRERRRQRLERVLERALTDKGTVLIPAFSIGRTQELLYELEDIIHQHQSSPIGDTGLSWSELPIILDSPLASRFTDVYRSLKPYWDEEAIERVLAGRRPLAFDQLLTVDDHDAHLRMVRHLADSARPAVVISGSGMCTGGRIVNYLTAMLHDPRHNVLFVGYQGAGTPGRTIQRFGPGGNGYVELDDKRYDIRAGVDSISGYSAHADQAGLIAFATGMKRPPKEIRILHGDNTAKQALAGCFANAFQGAGQPVTITVPGADTARGTPAPGAGTS